MRVQKWGHIPGACPHGAPRWGGGGQRYTNNHTNNPVIPSVVSTMEPKLRPACTAAAEGPSLRLGAEGRPPCGSDHTPDLAPTFPSSPSCDRRGDEATTTWSQKNDFPSSLRPSIPRKGLGIHLLLLAVMNAAALAHRGLLTPEPTTARSQGAGPARTSLLQWSSSLGCTELVFDSDPVWTGPK